MMNRGLRNKIFSIFTVTLLSCLVFSGCGQSGNGGNKGNDGNINSAEISDFEALTGIKETTEPDTEGPFYKIEYEVIAENAAPVLPEDFDYEPEEEEYRYASAPVSYGNILTENIESTSFGSKLYMLDALYGNKVFDIDKHPEAQISAAVASHTYLYYGDILKIYSPMDKSFKTIFLDRDTFDTSGYVGEEFKPDEFCGAPKAEDIIGVCDGKIYLLVRQYGEDNSEIRSFVATVNEKSETEIICEIPEDYFSYRLYIDNGRIWGMDLNGENVFTIEGDSINESTLNNKLEGFFEVDDENAYVYGITDGELWICDEPGGDIIYKLGKPCPFYNGTNYRLFVDDENVFCLGNMGVAFLVDGETHLCCFTDQDIVVKTCLGIYPDGDGFGIYADNNDGVLFLSGKPTDVNPATLKKTITARVPVILHYMEEVVTKYNMQSPNYRVVLKASTGSSYSEKLEVQLAAGEAPDLIDNTCVNIEYLAKKGAFLPLDDIIEGREDEYFASALESGRVDGVQYMLPYHIRLETYITSKNISGDLETWNLEQFMGIIESSDVEYITPFSAYFDIDYFLLYDRSNTEYIDWENGVSHLSEEPFIRVLEFVKKYGRENGDNWEADYERGIDDGTIAGDFDNMPEPLDFMNKYDGYFKGNASYIGFPRADISGGYLYAGGFMINAASENIDAAKDFLSWLISEEGQREYIKSSYTLGGTAPSSTAGHEFKLFCTLPARTDIFEEEIADYQDFRMFNHGEALSQNNILSYKDKQLSDEQITTFKRLLNEAAPIPNDADAISAIIEEELGAFLADQKTAEETAKIMDSRVQLYMDENK